METDNKKIEFTPIIEYFLTSHISVVFFAGGRCLTIAVNLSPEGLNLSSPQQSWG
jgi:hypothetical protein